MYLQGMSVRFCWRSVLYFQADLKAMQRNGDADFAKSHRVAVAADLRRQVPDYAVADHSIASVGF